MQVTRNGIDTAPGPEDWFTGAVYLDSVAAPSDGSRLSASSVHFTPGARTAWHTHPNGQTIYVTEGIGLCQSRGGPIDVIRPGDRVFFEPGEEHWHGATREPLYDARRDGRGRRRGQRGGLGRPRHRRRVRGSPAARGLTAAPSRESAGPSCNDAPMRTPQSGIFALGTSSHAYLELDGSAGRGAREARRSGRVPPRAADDDGRRQPRGRLPARALARGLARRRAGRARTGSTRRWSESTASRCRPPSTTPCSGSRAARTTSSSTSRGWRSAALAGLATVADETSSWPYRHDLDLTGFIDGTENPSLLDAPAFVLVRDGPGRGRDDPAAAEVGSRRDRVGVASGRRRRSW